MAERSPAPLPAADEEAGRGHAKTDRATGAGASGHGPEAAASVDLTGLVRAHHAAVYRYAWRLCGNAVEAEDLTQQTFLIAHTKLHQLRTAERACSWLLAVVRSRFLKSLRKPRPVAANVLDLNVDEIAETPEVDDVDREQLAAALGELPEEFRLVVLMFYFEELSYQEIAQELNIPLGTVMSRLSRAKAHLRSRLTKQSVGTVHRVAANGQVQESALGRTPPARVRQ